MEAALRREQTSEEEDGGEEELVEVACVGRSSSVSGAETQRVLWFPNGDRATWTPAAGASAEDLRQHVQIQKGD